jgi:NADP-reducing hydrogenase subunit HndB
MGKMTIDELEEIRGRARKKMSLREGEHTRRVIVHMGTCGIAAGARDVMRELLRAIEETGMEDVAVTSSGCAGLCSKEPMITIEETGKPAVKYCNLDAAAMNMIIKEHLRGGKIAEQYALSQGSEQTY